MPLDPQFAINTIFPAASAAYLIQTVPSPMLPAGYTLVKAIEADMHQAAPAIAQAIATNQVAHLKIVHAMLADSNIFGLVAWNAAEKTALVAFRGTQTIKDWIDDVDAVAVPYIAVPGVGLVHMGFQLVYEHVRKTPAKSWPGVQALSAYWSPDIASAALWPSSPHTISPRTAPSARRRKSTRSPAHAPVPPISPANSTLSSKRANEW